MVPEQELAMLHIYRKPHLSPLVRSEFSAKQLASRDSPKSREEHLTGLVGGKGARFNQNEPTI